MNPPILQRIVDLIVPLVEPNKIILFGSYARGDYSNISDIDLLILKKNLKNERELFNLIEYTFFDNDIDVAVDHVSMDYDKYYNVCNDTGYFYKSVEREGMTIYESV